MSAWQRDGWDAWGNHGWWDSRPNSWSSNDSSDGYKRPSYESQTTSWTSKPHHDDNQTWSHWAGSDASDQDTLCTSPLAGKKDKDKYKNISTLGCIGRHPLPLDERKRLFFSVCQRVDPTAGESKTHSKLSRVALASWDAACVQAGFWLICRASPKMPFRTLKTEDGEYDLVEAAKILCDAATSYYCNNNTALQEILDFIIKNSWDSTQSIIIKASDAGFIVEDAEEPESAGRRDSRNPARCYITEEESERLGRNHSPRVLRKHGTEEEIERLERHKKLLRLKKEIAQEEACTTAQVAHAKGEEPPKVGSLPIRHIPRPVPSPQALSTVQAILHGEGSLAAKDLAKSLAHSKSAEARGPIAKELLQIFQEGQPSKDDPQTLQVTPAQPAQDKMLVELQAQGPACQLGAQANMPANQHAELKEDQIKQAEDAIKQAAMPALPWGTPAYPRVPQGTLGYLRPPQLWDTPGVPHSTPTGTPRGIPRVLQDTLGLPPGYPRVTQGSPGAPLGLPLGVSPGVPLAVPTRVPQGTPGHPRMPPPGWPRGHQGCLGVPQGYFRGTPKGTPVGAPRGTQGGTLWGTPGITSGDPWGTPQGTSGGIPQGFWGVLPRIPGENSPG